MTRRAGFSLLEILLVLTIIGVLLGAGVVSLNPARRLAEARNQQREIDLRELEVAIKQYRLIEGEYPSDLSTTETEICDPEASSCSGFIDLSGLVPDILQSIPEDPNDPDTLNGNGYAATLSQNGIITLRAINAELEEAIQIN